MFAGKNDRMNFDHARDSRHAETSFVRLPLKDHRYQPITARAGSQLLCKLLYFLRL